MKEKANDSTETEEILIMPPSPTYFKYSRPLSYHPEILEQVW